MHESLLCANAAPNTTTPSKSRRTVENITSPKHGKEALTSPFKNKEYVNVSMSFNCTICNRNFTTQTALQNHIYAHHEDARNKEFQCGHCSKRFLHKSSMMRHEAMHRGRHSCLQCQRTFPKKEDLDTHVKVIHMGVKEFACHLCTSSFGYKRNLALHIKNIHHKKNSWRKEMGRSICGFCVGSIQRSTQNCQFVVWTGAVLDILPVIAFAFSTTSTEKRSQEHRSHERPNYNVSYLGISTESIKRGLFCRELDQLLFVLLVLPVASVTWEPPPPNPPPTQEHFWAASPFVHSCHFDIFVLCVFVGFSSAVRNGVLEAKMPSVKRGACVLIETPLCTCRWPRGICRRNPPHRLCQIVKHIQLNSLLRTKIFWNRKTTLV